MCVIAIKPKGIDMLPEDRIRDMFSSNPDGAGFMFVRKKKVLIRKGFMKVKHLLKAIQDEGLSKSDIIIFHFRIATAGSVSRGNTHPFPISAEAKDLRALEFTTDLAVAHNGILSYEHDKKEDLSDTMTFIRDILSDSVVREGMYDPAIFSLIEMSVGASRLVFVNGDGEFALIGGWSKDDVSKDGCLYSNLIFRWKSQKTTTFTVYSGGRNYTDNGNNCVVSSTTSADRNKPERASVVEYSNVVAVFPADTKCPKCQEPMQYVRSMFCHKCGVMFERDI